MNQRRKLPAYAKALLAERRAGNHPLRVQVIVGQPWRPKLAGVPMLALNAEEWAPGTFDWTACAGVAVEIIDRGMARAGKSWQELAQLAAEIARYAAPVMVRSSYFSNGRGEVTEMVWCLAAKQGGDWPAWWNDALQADYDRRWTRFYGDVAPWLTVEFARGAGGALA